MESTWEYWRKLLAARPDENNRHLYPYVTTEFGWRIFSKMTNGQKLFYIGASCFQSLVLIHLVMTGAISIEIVREEKQ